MHFRVKRKYFANLDTPYREPPVESLPQVGRQKPEIRATPPENQASTRIVALHFHDLRKLPVRPMAMGAPFAQSPRSEGFAGSSLREPPTTRSPPREKPAVDERHRQNVTRNNRFVALSTTHASPSATTSMPVSALGPASVSITSSSSPSRS